MSQASGTMTGGTTFDPSKTAFGVKMRNVYDWQGNLIGNEVDPEGSTGLTDQLMNRQQEFADRLSGIDNRQAPSARAAQIGMMQNANGANIDRTSTIQNAQVGKAQRINGQNIDQAALGGAASMQAAQAGQNYIDRAQDQQFRQSQLGLANALADQAEGRGPSLAGNQIREATDRTVAQQMAVAASQRGATNASLAQRNLANQAIAANQQAGRDAGQVRLQEQMAARQALGSVLGGARSQDIGVNTDQARMLQELGITNAGMLQQSGAQNAQLAQAMTLANQGSINQRAMQQAQLYQNANLSNQDAVNKFLLEQAQMNQQGNMFNSTNMNQRAMQQAALQQQALLANMQANNARTMQMGQYGQETNLANLQAQLQNQQMNDAMAKYYSASILGIDQAGMQNLIDYEKLRTGNELQAYGINQHVAVQNAGANAGMIGGGLGAAAAALALLSDEKSKTGIKSATPNLERFLGKIGESDMMKFDSTQPKTGNPIMGVAGPAVETTGDVKSPVAAAVQNFQTVPVEEPKKTDYGSVLSPIANAFKQVGANEMAAGEAGLAQALATPNRGMAIHNRFLDPEEMSDERSKTNKTSGAAATQNFLRSMSGKNNSNLDMSQVVAGGNASQPPGEVDYGMRTAPIQGYGPRGGNAYGGGYNGGGLALGQTYGQARDMFGGKGGYAGSYDNTAGTGNAGSLYTPVERSKLANMFPKPPPEKSGMAFSPPPPPTTADQGRAKGTNQNAPYQGSFGYNPDQPGFPPKPQPQPQTPYPTFVDPNSPSINMYAPQPFGNQLGFLSGLLGMSDEKSKKETETVPPEFEKQKAMLDALKAYEYRYKHPELPGAGEGTFVSPMAQDLEKTELGKSMVKTDPNTGYKMVDYGKGFGTMLASQAMLNERMNKLEKRRG